MFETKEIRSAMISKSGVSCAGGEKGIDEYYRQQEEMLESFVEMDSIAERGYMPSNTQVSKSSFRSFFLLRNH